jgi:hypothetical protein
MLLEIGGSAPVSTSQWVLDYHGTNAGHRAGPARPDHVFCPARPGPWQARFYPGRAGKAHGMRNEKKHGTDAMRAWPDSPTARRPGKACLGMAGLLGPPVRRLLRRGAMRRLQKCAKWAGPSRVSLYFLFLALSRLPHRSSRHRHRSSRRRHCRPSHQAIPRFPPLRQPSSSMPASTPPAALSF